MFVELDVTITEKTLELATEATWKVVLGALAAVPETVVLATIIPSPTCKPCGSTVLIVIVLPETTVVVDTLVRVKVPVAVNV